MIQVNIVGVGDVVRRLESIPQNIAAKLKDAVEGQATVLLRLAKEKVSGDVLRNRTGTLRRKLNMEIEASAARIVGKVGIKLSYAAAHEFGVKGAVSVRAHVRRNWRQMLQDQKLRIRKGKGIYRKQDDYMEIYDGKAQRGQGTISVRAHKRLMNLPERSYLRTALAERKQAIQDAIRGAIEGGIAQ
jgi:phage gpG-like protein